MAKRGTPMSTNVQRQGTIILTTEQDNIHGAINKLVAIIHIALLVQAFEYRQRPLNKLARLKAQTP